MGIVDLIPLHDLYEKLKAQEKENNWGFSFTTDDGKYETAIVFNEETRTYRKPLFTETWKDIEYPLNLICPDISDYNHKIVLEYEEESGNPRSGAYLAKKGHGHQGDVPNKRDARRNNFYDMCKFRFCRIWELELQETESVNEKLFHFLADCYCNRNTSKYQN